MAKYTIAKAYIGSAAYDSILDSVTDRLVNGSEKIRDNELRSKTRDAIREWAKDNLPVGVHLEWDQYCGCSCPCSPGYRIKVIAAEVRDIKDRATQMRIRLSKRNPRELWVRKSESGLVCR